MTRDRRGFRYALDGVRSVTRWKIDDLTLELARRQGEADDQQKRVDGLAGEFRAARTQLLDRRAARAPLDIGAERGAHAYLVRLQQALAAASAELRTLRERCDATRAALLEARRFADSLERDRDAALAEHDLAVARRLFAAADDDWMQRQHGRNP
jgi:hypothetical protein